jgi:hypothetical protein
LAIDSGANQMVVRRFKNPGQVGGFTTDAAISAIEASRQLKVGDCATSTRAGGRWELSGVDAGAMACSIDVQTGDAILWWSYKATTPSSGQGNEPEGRLEGSIVFQRGQFIAP